MSIKTKVLDYSNIFVTSDDTIEEAINVMNKGGYQLCLVVDNKILKGIITDSDLRKSILNSISKTQLVEDVMNCKPKIIKGKISDIEANRIMIDEHIFHLPVVNKSNEIIGLYVTENLNITHKQNTSFLIMAGGRGVRMLPLTNDTPKPMLLIRDQPIIEHIIQRAKSHGFSKFVISLGYLGEQIQNYLSNGEKLGVDISYIKEDKPLGTAGPISLLDTSIKSQTLCVTNGDVLSDIDYGNMLRFFKLYNFDAVIGVRQFQIQNPYGVIISKDNKLVDIAEKPVYKSTINAGIYILSSEIINLISPNTYFDMPDLLSKALSLKKNIGVFPIHEDWIDIGRVSDYEKAKKLVN